jgi:hypothetical protein
MWELDWEGNFEADEDSGPTLLRLASVIHRIADGVGSMEGPGVSSLGFHACIRSVTHAKVLLVFVTSILDSST